MSTAGIADSMELIRAFRREQVDPNGFYSLLATRSVAQVGRYVDLTDRTVLDVGGGPGYFADAFRAEGARYVGLDADAGELAGRGEPEKNSLQGSALALPFQSGSVDVCYSSNVLEHVPDPWRMGEEMIRVTRPGGTVFLAFTNWLSPWGGHETSPWHYLGGHRAAARYQRRTGRPPKNVFGQSLFPVSVAGALQWAGKQQGVDLVDAFPRYHPAWAKAMLRVPAAREVLTWNLALALRRR
jgi:SAM-dependent methyltransferase